MMEAISSTSFLATSLAQTHNTIILTYGIYPHPVTSRICLSLICMRGSQFTGNTSQAIGMYFNFNKPNECVRILDPVYTGDPKFNAGISNIIPISNLNEITVGDGTRAPDPAIFGAEPAHTWCYYFEKADLARQMQDWPTIIKTWRRSASQRPGLQLRQANICRLSKHMPRPGNGHRHYELSLNAQNNTAGLDPLLCNNWQRFAGISRRRGQGDISCARQKQNSAGQSIQIAVFY